MPFLPPIAGHALFMDASDLSKITAASNAVSQWVSGDAGAKTFVQATAGNKPQSGLTYLNGKNTINFQDSFRWVTRGAATDLDFAGGNGTVFILSKATGAAQSNNVEITTSANAFQSAGWYTQYGSLILNSSGSNGAAGTAFKAGDRQWHLCTYTDDATGGVTTAFADRRFDGPTTATTTHAASTGTQIIGAYDVTGSGVADFVGEIALILVYQSLLNRAQINVTEQAIRDYWLPQSLPATSILLTSTPRLSVPLLGAPLFTKTVAAAASTSAAAGVATGTGQAYDATVNVQPNVGLAAGTGLANDAVPQWVKAPIPWISALVAPRSNRLGLPSLGSPLFAQRVQVPATTATGTGTAYDATNNIAPNSGNAAGIGAAYGATVQWAQNPMPWPEALVLGPLAPNRMSLPFLGSPLFAQAVQVSVGTASGSGAAYDATLSIAPNVGLAGGIGTTQSASISLSPNAGTGSGTGTASNATVLWSVNFVPATMILLAPAPNRLGEPILGGPIFRPIVVPQVGTANAGLASGTGAANNASISLAPNAANASASGSASGASTSIASSSGRATGTGAAGSVAGQVSGASGAATGVGASGAPAGSIGASAQLATGVGISSNASTSLAATSGLASGTGAAGAAAGVVAATSGTATGVGGVGAPSGSLSVFVGAAIGSGTAYGAAVSPAVAAGLASGVGAAFSPIDSIALNSGTASGSGSAFNAPPSIFVASGSALGAGACYGAATGVAPLIGTGSGSGSAYDPHVHIVFSINIGSAIVTSKALQTEVASTVNPASPFGTAITSAKRA